MRIAAAARWAGTSAALNGPGARLELHGVLDGASSTSWNSAITPSSASAPMAKAIAGELGRCAGMRQIRRSPRPITARGLLFYFEAPGSSPRTTLPSSSTRAGTGLLSIVTLKRPSVRPPDASFAMPARPGEMR